MSVTSTAHAEAERLTAEAAKIAERAETARVRAQQAAARAEEERRVAVLTIRRRHLDEWRAGGEQAANEEVDNAYRKLVEAVVADGPTHAAWVEWQAAGRRRHARHSDADTARQALEGDGPRIPPPPSFSPTFSETLERILTAEVARRHNDWLEEREAELDNAGR